MTSQPVRMGRPPKTSAEEILAAAARLEPGALQLTDVARDLGISVKTVYYYFPTRKALLDALADRAVDRGGLPPIEQCATWREVLSEVARWFFHLGATQPGWYLETEHSQRLGVRLLLQVRARLRELGWDDASVLTAQAVVSNWAIASGESDARTRERGLPDGTVALGDLVQGVAPAELDQLQQLVDAYRPDDYFEVGLATVLAGVEATLLRPDVSR